MYAKNVNKGELKLALKKLNEKYNNNVNFKRLEQYGNNKMLFTLKVKDSSGSGARTTHNGRKLVSACWHVHGYFYEEVFKINPHAIIESSYTKIKTITKDSGNWQEIPRGTYFNPANMSDLCECEY